MQNPTPTTSHFFKVTYDQNLEHFIAWSPWFTIQLQRDVTGDLRNPDRPPTEEFHTTAAEYARYHNLEIVACAEEHPDRQWIYLANQP